MVAPAVGELSDITDRAGQTLTRRPLEAVSDAIKSLKLATPQPTAAAPQPVVAAQGAAAPSTEIPLPSVLSSLTPPSVLHGDVPNSALPQPTAAEPAEVAPPIAAEAPLPPPAWPISLSLVASADALAKINGCGSWAENVHRALEQLNRLSESDTAKAAEVLRDLRRLASEAGPMSKRLRDPEAAMELRRLQYDMVRRLDIWEELSRPRSVASVLQLRTPELIALVERYEQAQRSADGRRLAELSRLLLASSTPADKELGRRLHMHYRNANVRIAFTAALLDQLLPEQQASNEPVAETILGEPVQGQSTTAARLMVQLLPDPQLWRFNLVAAGTVDSLTSTTHGPVTFVNQGTARFVVRKLVLVNADGVRVQPATAEADANTSLNGMHTSYDSIPLLRSAVRNYAMSQRQQQIDQANWESAQKVAARACSRVDEQVEPRLVEAERKLRDRLLQPLKDLGLDPTVVASALKPPTSAARLPVGDWRAPWAACGGFHVLAGPRLLADSHGDRRQLMAVHESVLNNLLDNLDLAGRKFALPELLKHLNSKLGCTDAKLPDDLPEGVQITFAAEQPLHIRCDDDRLVLVLHIAEIRQGKHRWHDFEVRASYKPTTDGLSACLQRDGTIELGGQYQGRPEVALRGIFSKVLSRERKLELIPKAVVDDPRLADLQVTQLLMDDGWIALSIGPKAAVARRPAK